MRLMWKAVASAVGTCPARERIDLSGEGYSVDSLDVLIVEQGCKCEAFGRTLSDARVSYLLCISSRPPDPFLCSLLALCWVLVS